MTFSTFDVFQLLGNIISWYFLFLVILAVLVILVIFIYFFYYLLESDLGGPTPRGRYGTYSVLAILASRRLLTWWTCWTCTCTCDVVVLVIFVLLALSWIYRYSRFPYFRLPLPWQGIRGLNVASRPTWFEPDFCVFWWIRKTTFWLRELVILMFFRFCCFCTFWYFWYFWLKTDLDPHLSKPEGLPHAALGRHHTWDLGLSREREIQGWCLYVHWNSCTPQLCVFYP